MERTNRSGAIGIGRKCALTNAAEFLERREREAMPVAIGEHGHVGQWGPRQDGIATRAAPPPPSGVERAMIAELSRQPLGLISRLALPLDEYLLQADDARIQRGEQVARLLQPPR